MSLEDILALRSLRRAKQGIDASKLAMGDPKKRKRDDETEEQETVQYGLQQRPRDEDEDVDPLEDAGAKARRAVRKNNFTQQTNALDVDKHMLLYIEENLDKIRREKKQAVNEETQADAEEVKPTKVEDDIVKFGDKYKTRGVELKEGSLTSSLAMLSAIPEVDLGMEARLRNIEETEKAKRAAVEEKQSRGRGKKDSDEARLAATRFYNPHLRQESDGTLLKNAKLQALGLSAPERRHNHDRPEMATDEAVMERFRKRMKR